MAASTKERVQGELGEHVVAIRRCATVVKVRFADGIAWMTPPAAVVGAPLTRAAAAALVGLREADIDPEIEPRVVTCGVPYSLIGVRVDSDVLRAADGPAYPFTFCRAGYSADADFAARMHFFDGAGIREDPATGSASAAFAGYLRARGAAGDFILEQGFAIERPSRIYLHVADVNAVGGKVRAVAEGRFLS